MGVLKVIVTNQLVDIRTSKEIELKKHMNSWKPATINPVFEAAVQSMEQSGKPKKDEALSIIVDKTEPDPIEMKLKEILKAEAKHIEDNPIETDPSLNKYPAGKNSRKRLPENMTEEAIYQMLMVKKMKPKEIAVHYGLSSTQVSQFIYQHDIRNYGKKRKLSAIKEPAETERP